MLFYHCGSHTRKPVCSDILAVHSVLFIAFRSFLISCVLMQLANVKILWLHIDLVDLLGENKICLSSIVVDHLFYFNL